MIDKLSTLWTNFGIKVMSGYMVFVEKIGPASIIIAPIVLLGFTIPWFLVQMILLGLSILHGQIVYNISIKEQVGWLKEGFDEYINEIKHR